MTEDRAKRKLTAILSADVKGYSRLMGEDERATVETLKTYRDVMGELIRKYRGRVIDSPGDNVLSEFASVVDAVECAVKIQEELKANNEDLPENRRMEFRIGVNLGDVIEDGGRIYGDGVNIAARIEGLAEGGGICISGNAYDQIGKKLSFGYEYLGEQTVKNIEKPVRVYRVLMEPEYAGKVIVEQTPRRGRWAVIAAGFVLIIAAGALGIWHFYLRAPRFEPASVNKMAYPLPKKPSIAILPFVNMSGDPKQEYFSDGMTEDLITDLSRYSGMFVISRNSVFRYKGKAVKPKQVSEELGVRYLLEGSVRKSGDMVRITAQLIDAVTGGHLWAERYDRDLKDIFKMQDELTQQIVSILKVKVEKAEQERALRKETDNLNAFDYNLRGWWHYQRFTKEENDKARKMFEKATELEPKFASAYAGLGFTYYEQWTNQWSQDPHNLDKAFELANKAMAIDDSVGGAYTLLSHVYLWKKQHDQAINLLETVIAHNPNNANGYADLAEKLVWAGKSEKALELVKKAMRLNPYYPVNYLATLGYAYFSLGQYNEAIEAEKKVLIRNPDYLGSHMLLAVIYTELGRDEEARAQIEKALKTNPQLSLESFSKRLPFKDRTQFERLINAWRKAGLPEHPPLPLPDKPSIAVLPLKNISDDPKQEFFVDGMTDDLITDLSKISGLFVIASNSVFTYKGKSVKVEQIGRELGVRYVLEGSVRRADNQVRINAQLIDTKTGGHLWAERYDDKWENIFALQDKITHKIVSVLAVKLTPREQEQVARKGTDSIEAYDAFLKGIGHLIRWTTAEDTRKAVFYLKKAIELDPNYGRAYAALGFAYFYDYQGHLGLPIHKAKVKAREYLKMSMKNPNPGAHSLAAHINYYLNLHKEAVSEAEKALALAPKSSDVHSTMAEVLNWACNPKEAVKFAELEMRYDPSRIGSSLWHLGVAHFCMGKLEQAITYFKRCLTHKPEFDTFALPFLAAAYSHLGRDMEAQVALKDFTVNKGWNPNLRDVMTVAGKFRDPEVNERLASGLLKAGLPGEPSEYYKIYEENRLTGKELKELILGSDIGKWWIEGDMLCSKWKLFDDSCFPVFRNPDGTPEGKDEFLLINFIDIDPFSSVPDLSKKTKPTTIKKEVKAAPPPMKWTSDADGIGKDGVFTRKNPPSFSFKYPIDFTIAKLIPGNIFRVTGTTGLPVVEVSVGKITGDVKKFLEGFAEGYKNYLENSGIGTYITINYKKSLPTVTYGADYLAQEFEIDWKYGGNLPLTTYANVIVKEGYYISMSGIKGKDIGDIDKFKAIFKTIELEP